ncbi:ADP ribosylation factor family Ras of Complex Roc domain [Trypanosoma vivax]|uniref:Ras-related protein rab-5 n=1 Tax=Trypanosoma vivax (strain Y486) TaxID=1055687 RepID=G0U456_TRYVY|nr:ras-related protein rab-5 [Trypanosoma vivax]KAH8611687.1 ADP ribosylation factor family Ras of Complex Roc domain [Trypanosoma vivax]CCC52218.1 ras-related protein rab-5 [Trypanosoma vivax Y486]
MSAMTALGKKDVITAKTVLLGESAVGKSSIALRFARNEFSLNQETTIGAAFLSRNVTVPPPAQSSDSQGVANGGTVKFEIWDTAGQERYRSLAPIYYRGACGALVVYDITSADSLKKAQTWIRELRANADPTLVIVLVGNKKDLEALRQVSHDDGAALAQEEGVNGFFEVSAKDNYNVEEVFSTLARQLLEHGLGSSLSPSGGAGVRGTRRLEPPARPQKRENDCAC